MVICFVSKDTDIFLKTALAPLNFPILEPNNRKRQCKQPLRKKILVFAALTAPELEQLQPYTTAEDAEDYQQGEIVMQEDDRSYY